MQKFENVDLFAAMGAVIQGHTAFYKTDFEIDKDILREMAAAPAQERMPLLWLCRPAGTHLFPERNVFIKDIAPHNTWRYHYEQSSDPVLAYAVELHGEKNGKLLGNLYELDYDAHARHVRETALPPAAVHINFADGHSQDFTFDQYANHWSDIYYEHGKVHSLLFSSQSDGELSALLAQEQSARQSFPTGVFAEHLETLSDAKILTEAQRLHTALQAPKEPNSPNKTHFMAQLSPHFLLTSSGKEQDRLFEMLPYKSLVFAGMRKLEGEYALIKGDEPRDKPLRLPKPSIKKQLHTENKSAPIPHKKVEKER